MSDYSTSQGRNEFVSQITDLVQEYLDSKGAYPASIGISIDSETLEVNLCAKEDCYDHEDWYSIDEFIRTVDQLHESDIDVIYELASGYCFVG